MNRKFLKAAFSSAMILCTLSISAYAAAPADTNVTENDVAILSSPTADSATIALTPKGTSIVIGSKSEDEETEASKPNSAEVVRASCLSLGTSPAGLFTKAKLFDVNATIARDLSTSDRLSEDSDDESELTVISIYGDWYKVSYDSVTGYVKNDSLSLSGDASLFMTLSKESDAELGQTIADTAQEYLGTPYVWGGTTPAGFDCSGFVQYVYKQCGYTISRTAASIYQEGAYIDKADLQIGDAICFSSHTEAIGHIGIYIGNGQFIHASSGSGCVIISNLDDSYYATRYVGSRHLI